MAGKGVNGSGGRGKKKQLNTEYEGEQERGEQKVEYKNRSRGNRGKTDGGEKGGGLRRRKGSWRADGVYIQRREASGGRCKLGLPLDFEE